MAGKLGEIVSYLDELLPPDEFADDSKNGLQVESPSKSISKVAFAVDAGLSIIQKAIKQKCKLLVVHHGMLWGHENRISGRFGKKVTALISGGCSLYASHLPLDAHQEVGNNVELARFFDLKVTGTFFEYHGKAIGTAARVRDSKGLPLSYFAERALSMVGATTPLLLPFGPKLVKTVAIVSGGGAMAIEEAARNKFDLLITGEPKQASYHEAQEQGLSVLFAGHYATETFGVMAVARKLKKKFGVQTVFIDEPTGI